MTGVNLLEWLDISPEELSFAERFSKLQSVVGYLSSFNEDTQRFLVNKATRGKQVDKLEHMFQYTLLLRRKSEYEQVAEDIKREESVVAFDPIKMEEITLRKKELDSEIQKTLEELYFFER